MLTFCALDPRVWGSSSFERLDCLVIYTISLLPHCLLQEGCSSFDKSSNLGHDVKSLFSLHKKYASQDKQNDDLCIFKHGSLDFV